MGGYGTSRSGRIIAQGQLAVGSTTVQFSATAVPCALVWVGAPSANHTKGSQNTGRILVGKATLGEGGNAGGGRPIETTDYAGFLIPVNDLSHLWATGFNANDVVEYQAYGDPA